MCWERRQGTKTDLEAQVWIKRGSANQDLLVSFYEIKRGVIMGKDTSKPIRFKTIQKNTKLADFSAEENLEVKKEEQAAD